MKKTFFYNICKHRCTRVENPGEGPRGSSIFSPQIAVTPIAGFITFLLTSVLKFDWGGGGGGRRPILTLPPHPPTVCLYEWKQMEPKLFDHHKQLITFTVITIKEVSLYFSKSNLTLPNLT
jgi:hypothetical protein